MRHGYKGAFEMAATVDYLFAFAATARAVATTTSMRSTTPTWPTSRAGLLTENNPAAAGVRRRLMQPGARPLETALQSGLELAIPGGGSHDRS